MAQRIARGRATQDDILAFVTARLQRVSEIQQREIALTVKDGAHWKAWRAMGDAGLPQTKEGHPTRWRKVAEAYEEALRAATRGDLSRAKRLVQDARGIEEHVLAETTDLVRTDDLEDGASPDPAWLADAVLSATQPCDVPFEAHELVRRIVNVTAEMPKMRGKPKLTLPWWAEEEDEEDEEHEEDG